MSKENSETREEKDARSRRYFKTSEERTKLLIYVNNKIISGGGMDREEYNSIKNELVCIGWTVQSFIEASMGEVEWVDNKLTYMGKLVITRQK